MNEKPKMPKLTRLSSADPDTFTHPNTFDLYRRLDKYIEKRSKALDGKTSRSDLTLAGGEYYLVPFTLYGVPINLLENVKRLIVNREYTLQDTYQVCITFGLNRFIHDEHCANWMALSSLTRSDAQDFSTDVETWKDVISLTSHLDFTIPDCHIGYKKKHPIRITDPLRSRLNQVGDDAGIPPYKLASLCLMDAISRMPRTVGDDAMRIAVKQVYSMIRKRINRVVGLLVFSDLELHPALMEHIRGMGYEERLSKIT